MAKPFVNSGDPDQTPHSAASDLGLRCLPITFLWVSRLQWVNKISSHHFGNLEYPKASKNIAVFNILKFYFN